MAVVNPLDRGVLNQGVMSGGLRPPVLKFSFQVGDVWFCGFYPALPMKRDSDQGGYVRQHGPLTRLVETRAVLTGNGNRSPVISGSGNQALYSNSDEFELHECLLVFHSISLTFLVIFVVAIDREIPQHIWGSGFINWGNWVGRWLWLITYFCEQNFSGTTKDLNSNFACEKNVYEVEARMF